MTTSLFSATARPPRILTHAHRQRLERSSDHYLQACYRKKTAVRAPNLRPIFGVTPEYRSGIVRQLTGKTPRSFLRAKQLRYTGQLLRAMSPGAFREMKK